MKLVFATNNPHKLQELKELMPSKVELISLSDLEINEDIPETSDTLEGNASQKAFFIYDRTGYNCFADDTGLEIPALDNEPGVYSARYAGPAKDSEANIQKVLSLLAGKKSREARFRTVISLIVNGEECLFEGVVEGQILLQKRGVSGFGYDPVFLPDGCDRSFAEMSMEEKNRISHRGRAVAKLIDYLKTLS